MTTYASIAEALTKVLSLGRPPISVSFADQIPEGVPIFSGTVPAGCRFWQEAGDHVFATVARDHELCSIGAYTHNLESTPAQEKDLGDALKVFADLGYVRPADLPFIPVLNRTAKAIIYGPLGESPVAPDVILLFVRADQTLILSEAAQQLENALPPAMGRPACAVVSQAYNTGRTALSGGCCGARAYLDVLKPEIALFAVPGSILNAFTDRVVELAQANRILTAFHTRRREDIESGKRPSVQESLAAMG
jgi:uncharacterized protein (DUF169 family)